MITITSKKEGFRRLGVAHSQTPTTYDDGQFTAEELEILQKESMLIVVVTAEKEPEEPKSSKGKTGKEKPPAASASEGAKGEDGKPPAGTESGDTAPDGASA
jgi:hypothetical protein